MTGADVALRRDNSGLLARLAELGAPPTVLGFGIANPDQVRSGLAMGARGVISGSAVVQRMAQHLEQPEAMRNELREFVQTMKAATRPTT